MNASTEFWRDPAMPYVESRRACDSRACYRSHSHPTYSIGAVDRGISVFSGVGDGLATLHAGTVVFVPPMRVHACNPLPEAAWSYQMLHLDARWLGAIREEAAEVRSTGVADEPIRLVRNAWVYARFCRLNALLFSEASVHDKEAALIGFIGDCDDVHGKPIALPPGDPARHRQLLPVMDFLRREDGDTVPLTELADMAGMSRYQLIRAFRASTGMTPHAWQLNQRVNRARERLLAGEELADVAHRLGFADQSHFQRVFKAHAGVTPGRYRA